jgi:SiaC family regulatory phosphoprotein
MKSFFSAATGKTPKIILDKEKNEFIISGRSLPEDVREFYYPMLDWLQEYFKDPNDKTNLIIEISYYNTASSKIFLDMLFLLKDYYDKGAKIIITWRYEKEDEEVLEAGEDLMRVSKMPMVFEEVDYID